MLYYKGLGSRVKAKKIDPTNDSANASVEQSVVRRWCVSSVSAVSWSASLPVHLSVGRLIIQSGDFELTLVIWWAKIVCENVKCNCCFLWMYVFTETNFYKSVSNKRSNSRPIRSWNARTFQNELLWTSWCSVGEQITFTKNKLHLHLHGNGPRRFIFGFCFLCRLFFLLSFLLSYSK